MSNEPSMEFASTNVVPLSFWLFGGLFCSSNLALVAWVFGCTWTPWLKLYPSNLRSPVSWKDAVLPASDIFSAFKLLIDFASSILLKGSPSSTSKLSLITFSSVILFPKTFTLAQLQKLGHTTMATILQCSGNGRGFFKHKPRGSQWKTGAAACIFWTGVPMKTVVDACGGISGDSVYMTSEGVDHVPTGLDPKKAMIARSVPKKVYKDAMLAWEMNGVPVPNAHGGPLRMITPGYFGINNVKQ